jgi:NAD(P)-dependent dehydrogenase (short-subunit alcohol dehydrogenase family)
MSVDPGGDALSGRVAFVTGGTGGIGVAICRSLASHGAVVAIGYSRNRDRTEALLRELQAAGADGSIHQGNVSSPEDCRRTIDEVVDQHGQIDILVNNAGIVSPKSVLRMADEEWRKVIDVNLSGTFYMSQAGLNHMVGQAYGRIINISSIVGETGLIGHANYAASKSGLYGLTKTLAREAAFQLDRAGKLNDASRNITVNTVEPGFIATGMLETADEGFLEGIRRQVPLGRLGRPEEIARVVQFLCEDASNYITGQVWSVNGGLDM